VEGTEGSFIARDYKAGRAGVLLAGFGGCAAGDVGLGLGGGDSEHGLTILAFDELAADFFRDREDLAALEVGTEHLDGHSGLPTFIVWLGRVL